MYSEDNSNTMKELKYVDVYPIVAKTGVFLITKQLSYNIPDTQKFGVTDNIIMF